MVKYEVTRSGDNATHGPRCVAALVSTYGILGPGRQLAALSEGMKRLVGDGPLKADLESQAARIGFDNAVLAERKHS